MKVSYRWLQTYFESPLPEPQKIADLLIFHAFEVESVEEKNGDSILDVKVLPNRAHDCLSHLGIAKEIALVSDLKIKKPEIRTIEKGSSREIAISVNETEACDRYIGRVVEGVTVGPSPKWLVDLLEAVGQRSINNIVDIANFVMLSVGQPLHAFDADKLESLTVRFAYEGDHITTLDNKDVKLDKETLVIADGDQPLAIAGIKGGKAAEIGAQTKNIVIEAAHFQPTLIRKTSFRHGIRTDASHRFENELSPELAEYGMDLMTSLVLELAGGKAGEKIDVNHSSVQKLPKRVTAKEVNKLLGTSFSEDQVRGVQEKIDYAFRMDLERSADMIEEVGRVLGYDNAPVVGTTEQFPMPKPLPSYYYAEQLRHHFASRGYSEVLTYAFVSTGEVELKNALQSDRTFLRATLAPSVIEKLEFNKLHADVVGLAEVKIFEIAPVFLKNREEVHCAVASSGKTSVANDIPWPVANLYKGQGNSIEFCLDDVIASLPVPETYTALPYAPVGATVFKPFSSYPHSSRDIALFVPQETQESEIVHLLMREAGPLLMRAPHRFDRFEKKLLDGTTKVSYAFRLVFQSFERTLTTEEVNEIMTRVTAAANAQVGWQVR